MKRRPAKRNSTAMTDIAFLLLLFFLVMAVTGFRTPAVVNPPVEEQGVFINEQEALRLYITAQGELLGESGPLTLEACEASLESNTMASNRNVVITADKKTKFKDIAPVIAMLQRQGITQVSFAVDIQPEEVR